jgi:hypothetical protein
MMSSAGGSLGLTLQMRDAVSLTWKVYSLETLYLNLYISLVLRGVRALCQQFGKLKPQCNMKIGKKNIFLLSSIFVLTLHKKNHCFVPHLLHLKAFSHVIKFSLKM